MEYIIYFSKLVFVYKGNKDKSEKAKTGFDFLFLYTDVKVTIT